MAFDFKLKDPNLVQQQCHIDGQWVDADNGKHIEVRDPASGEVVGCVPRAGAAETQRAIDAAERALPAWRARTAADRARVLRRWYELLMQNQEDLARLMTLEQGKPLAESRGEIAYAASFIEWFAEEGKRAYGEIIPSPFSDKRLLVLKQPIGVCAAITPWNFPSAMITRKAGPALAAGCTMVLKPAGATPLSALALAELAARAGIPAGVFNVVTGDSGPIGETLTRSPVVRKLSFTGSTEIGRQLMAQSAPTLKKLSLELGGNAPFIVFDDADVDAAVAGAVASKYRNTGQTCVCTNRFLVQSGIYDSFADKLAAASQALKVGSGLDEGVVQGPLINQAALEKVEELVADATNKGAKVLAGGQRHELGGLWYQPTVLTGIEPGMDLTRQEIFGPVSALMRFDTEEEAIAHANDTEFGLASYLYSRDMARIWRVSEALEYGMVGINTGLISTEVAPFGGVKQSGLGREGSRHGLEDYMELKYLALGGV
ncbi:NAD-dependent succinate-semialdehyde dehydrogenase [Pusillimonas noertemannii]|uniref:Succinate-semialdehyde dehydrogenase/glutarate-semialdehyde dehydrogenase n=1 Tax=Pusillimonas noertemannii TaxID=305977 RepID=A0A2U1CM30_9BURK|nr:NAD-dependent succinate-semialdehyde dehydrogenase [Pusillimonas noertemannii]NYT68933.1 NAD-dependent succinate-semialdehyde dehydrogenase [Pusillimonas noertemannii]PVY62047.1 succinate-semialdehyde dehydrogenase/glutarate-semialdehyde dehydrogenase [Pusillimonas noertemannii]TFL10954.1 NAD-dependent succinate-semialdehyde dehydrogenase [Pusillimonas noertemannii]